MGEIFGLSVDRRAGRRPPADEPPLPVGRITVLGILNVTPDSFSDGGRWHRRTDAVAHGLEMAAAGADVIDVGGESTRPGAARIPEAEELRRVLPVVAQLSARGVPVAIDTTRARVAAAALRAGAQLVNDVSGGRADPHMSRVVRDAGCRWILMHNRGTSATMHTMATYRDVVAEVQDELSTRVDAALAGGVAPDALIIDPGLGFAKKPAHNWQLLAQLDRLRGLGFPVLIGASRKSFLGTLLADRNGRPRPTGERDDATAAVTACAALAGAWGVRVHDVSTSIDAATVAAAIRHPDPA